MSSIQVVSWSELDTIRQCPHKHELSYIERWTPPTNANALTLGSAWHLVMQHHLLAVKNNTSTSDAVGPIFDAMGEQTIHAPGQKRGAPSSEVRLVDHVWWMYEGYVQKYGLEPEWEIIAVEWAAEVPLRHPSGRASRFNIKLKIDVIVRTSYGLWVVDHKSGTSLPTDKEPELNDQFGLYTWAMRQLGNKVVGCIYDAAKTRRNKEPDPLDKRFKRVLLNRSQNELDTIAAEALADVKQAYAPGALRIRRPNEDTCRWRCSFTEACLNSRKGLVNERDFLRDTGFTQDHARH